MVCQVSLQPIAEYTNTTISEFVYS